MSDTTIFWIMVLGYGVIVLLHFLRNKPRDLIKGEMKVVLIQGAFDIINWGHVKAMKLAKSYGDYLIIGLNSNELIKSYKQRDAVLPWYQKAFILRSLKYVDKVVKAEAFSPIELLRKYDVDVYCITEEWTSTKKAEFKFMESKPGGEIKYLPRFPGVIPTSEIKKILLNEEKEGYHK